jgi:hypothetical protein
VWPQSSTSAFSRFPRGWKSERRNNPKEIDDGDKETHKSPGAC